MTSSPRPRTLPKRDGQVAWPLDVQRLVHAVGFRSGGAPGGGALTGSAALSAGDVDEDGVRPRGAACTSQVPGTLVPNALRRRAASSIGRSFRAAGVEPDRIRGADLLHDAAQPRRLVADVGARIRSSGVEQGPAGHAPVQVRADAGARRGPSRPRKAGS